MKWIHRFLVVTFVLLCIQFSFIFMDGLGAAYMSLAGFKVNRFVQPVALALIVYGFFKKPSARTIVFYCVHILFILFFFLEFIALIMAIEDSQSGGLLTP